MEAAHREVAESEQEVIEPDWTEFRSAVRDALLSRSAKRASVVRRWTGWPIRPVMAWTISAVMVVGVSAGALLWHQNTALSSRSGDTIQQPAVVQSSEDSGIETEMTVWSQTSIFEELSQLETTEEDNLRTILMEVDPGASEQ